MKLHSITTLLLLLVASLAGCASPEPLDDSTPDGTTDPPVDPLPPAGPLNVDLAFDGNLGAGFYACALVHCHGHDVVPGEDNGIVTPPAGRLRSASITLTWTAATPVTATLAFGIMIMDQCYGCNVTMLVEGEGKSPLTLTAENLDYWVGDSNWFHTYVRNTAVNEWTPQGGAYVTPDQAFSVVGTSVVEPAVATGAA